MKSKLLQAPEFVTLVFTSTAGERRLEVDLKPELFRCMKAAARRRRVSVGEFAQRAVLDKCQRLLARVEGRAR